MEKSIRIVLLAVFILLIAIVSFSFNNITGKDVTYKSSTISVTPTVVQQGEIITVTVKPGDYGVFNEFMWIYEKGTKYDTRIQATSRRICGKTHRCKDTSVVKYRILGTWEPGEYYVRVWEADKNNFYENDYVQAKFTIIENESYKTQKRM